MDIAKIAEAAGANFVARGTTYHVVALGKLMEQAFLKEGFSVIEVISQCPVHFGKLNGSSSSVEMLKRQRDNTVHVGAQNSCENAGKIVRGVLVERDQPGFVQRYRQMVDRAGHED